MPEFSNKAAFCITHRINGFGRLSEKSPEWASSQSPGLAALFAANPGYWIRFNLYPERVESGRNPFRVDVTIASIPRVGRKKRGQPWALLCAPLRLSPCCMGGNLAKKVPMQKLQRASAERRTLRWPATLS